MRRRNAFTLLEVLLAMVIAVMVLGAVYSFVGHQLRLAQSGRDVIERATLARSILNRVDTDLRSVIALNDPGRFRLQPAVSADTSTAAVASSTSTTGGAGTAGKSSPSAASSASSASTPGGSSASASGSSSSATSTTLSPIDLPRGVIGSSTELNIYVSRLPSEVFGNDPSNDPNLLTSDLRRISYWMGGDGDKAGLCRMEVRLITSDQAADTTLPTGDVGQYLYAGEVKNVEFGYFDGTAWQTSWDSTTLGPDQATPIGSPRAISIKIEVAQGSTTKTYRHVIAIACADGTPSNNNAEGGTIAP